MMTLSFLLQSGGIDPIVNFLPWILILAVMYLFFIRPQQKKQKDQATFVTDMKKGDEVVTSSGMIGRINKIEGNIIQLQVDQKTYIRVLKGTISSEMTTALNSKEEVETKS